MSNIFLDENVEQIFEHHFLDELKKRETKVEREKRLKNQKIYEYKYSKMQDLISFFDKIKNMNLYVKRNSEYDFYQFQFSNELLPFDYMIRESTNKENFPSPAIFVEDPITFEISITNDLSNGIHYSINFFGVPHPDKNIIKSKYDSVQELTIDLSKFFVRNVSRNSKTE